MNTGNLERWLEKNNRSNVLGIGASCDFFSDNQLHKYRMRTSWSDSSSSEKFLEAYSRLQGELGFMVLCKR